MRILNLLSVILGVALLCGTASADYPKVKRSVGADGVPVISIKGEKPAPVPTAEPEPVEAPPAKPFKVYDLDGEASAPKTEVKVVVLPSPAQIAPGAGYGYGGFPYGGFGYGGFGAPYGGFGYGGFGVGGFGIPYGGFYGPGAFGPHCNTSFSSNYTNPPVNYTNPPANYRPLTPIFNGFSRGYCR